MPGKNRKPGYGVILPPTPAGGIGFVEAFCALKCQEICTFGLELAILKSIY